MKELLITFFIGLALIQCSLAAIMWAKAWRGQRIKGYLGFYSLTGAAVICLFVTIARLYY